VRVNVGVINRRDGNRDFESANKQPRRSGIILPRQVCRTVQGFKILYSIAGDLSLFPFLILQPDLTMNKASNRGGLPRDMLTWMEAADC
jgi:hypothetical protein